MDICITKWRRLLWPQGPSSWNGYEVIASRKIPSSALLQPMDLSAHELSADENAQLLSALMGGAEPAVPVVNLDALLSRVEDVYRDSMDIAEYVLGSPVEWWDVEDMETRVRWALWLYGIDCGRIYPSKGTKFVGSIVQNVLWCDEEPELWRALARAQSTIRRQAPRSQVAHVAFNAAVRCPRCSKLAEIWKETFEDEIPCPSCSRTFNAVAAMRRKR